MKPLFRCDYCDKIDTEDVIAKHELECINNYNNHSCYTCKHLGKLGVTEVGCRVGKAIAKGCILQNCDSWEWDEKDRTTKNPIATNSIFGGFFL
jgi:hypothetical protein